MRFVTLAFLFALVAPATAHASAPITWQSFDHTLPVDCDIIDAKIEQNVVNPMVVEFVLDAAPEAAFFKGMQFWHSSGGAWVITTEGAKRRSSIQLGASLIPGGSIHFEKAQMFGAHTLMYDLKDVSPIKPGSRVTFHWAQDQCPNLGLGVQSGSPPTWLVPGETRTFQLTLRNAGTSWRPDIRLALEAWVNPNGYTDWQLTPIQITSVVNYGKTATVDLTITAPMNPNKHRFDLRIRQGDSGVTSNPVEYIIEVSPTQPKPPQPPPPPTMVNVPNVVGLSAAAAGKAIVGANLRLVSLNDPNPLDPNKTVVSQNPMAGTRVAQNDYVQVQFALDSQMFGWKSVNFYNCGNNGTLLVYRFDGDKWAKRGDLPAQWRDNQCPIGGPGFTDTTIDQAVNYYVVLDPTICTDPYDVRCRVYELQKLGDANGFDWFAMVQ